MASGTSPTINRLFSGPVQAAGGFSAGNPQPLFEGDYNSYDVSPDGRRFLMVKPTPEQNATSSSAAIVVVLNWPRALQERAPLK